MNGNRSAVNFGNRVRIANGPALAKSGAAGFTEFSIWGAGKAGRKVPTAGDATFNNIGGQIEGAPGGYTRFANNASAGNALLIAFAGTGGGYGGRILFYDDSTGGTSKIQLFGNGTLDIANHNKGLTIGTLDLNGGVIVTRLGSIVTLLKLTGDLLLKSSQLAFIFVQQDKGSFTLNTPFTILTARNLSAYTANQFTGNSLNGIKPVFTIAGNKLVVSFNKK